MNIDQVYTSINEAYEEWLEAKADHERARASTEALLFIRNLKYQAFRTTLHDLALVDPVGRDS